MYGRNIVVLLILLLFFSSCTKTTSNKQLKILSGDINQIKIQTNVIKGNIQKLDSNVKNFKKNIKHNNNCNNIQSITNIELDVEILQKEIDVLEDKTYQFQKNHEKLKTIIQMEIKQYQNSIKYYKLFVFAIFIFLVLLIITKRNV